MVSLPRVLTDNRDLNRWLQTVARELESLRESQGSGGGTTIVQRVTAGDGEPDTGDQVPTLAMPPIPVGLTAIGGLRKVALSWTNPFRYYANHARTRIYRATADRFDEAVEIGQARYVVYFDNALQPDTEYFYWIRWENTDAVLGAPAAESVSATPSETPERALAAVRAELQSDPLARALLADINSPPALLAETEAVTGARERLLLDIAAAHDTALLSLESRITGTTLGPAPNTFTGDTRDDAETARDAQAVADEAWLAQYDRRGEAIELTWGA